MIPPDEDSRHSHLDPFRRCTACGEEKAAECFPNQPYGRPGVKSKCKACCKLYTDQYRVDNRERLLEKQRQHYRKMMAEVPELVREKGRDRMRRWRKSNPATPEELAARRRKENGRYREDEVFRDTRKERARLHRKKYARRIAEARLRFRAEHPDRIIATRRRCYAKHRLRFFAKGHDRRARLRSIGGTHTNEQWEALKARYEYRCLACGRQEPEIRLTRDHVVPIARGGSNLISNIQPLCKRDNSRKWIRIIDYRPRWTHLLPKPKPAMFAFMA